MSLASSWLNRIVASFERRTELRRADLHKRGYDVAKGMIAKGITTEHLRSMVEESRDFGDMTEWDRGVLTAVEEAEKIEERAHAQDRTS